jgi:molybdopterin-guanine dinucleotide biosynthesis protein A
VLSTGVTGLVLAGGQGRRMGGSPKVLRELHGASLLTRVQQRLARQVDAVLVSTDDPAVRAACAAYPILADALPGFAGPLAGILSGLEYMRAQPRGCWLLSVAADTPWFPDDLAARLREAAEYANAEVAVACSGGVVHPVFALWAPALAGRLREALVDGGQRSVRRFQAGCRHVEVDWPAVPRDPFFNINTPQDLEVARRCGNPATG